MEKRNLNVDRRRKFQFNVCKTNWLKPEYFEIRMSLWILVLLSEYECFLMDLCAS